MAGAVKRTKGKKAKKRPSRPKGEYTQGARLLELYDRLHHGQRLRAAELAEKLGTSKRTVERDIRELVRVLGERRVKKEEVPGRGVVYFLPSAERKWEVTRWQVLAVATGVRLTAFLSGKRFATQVDPLLDQMRQALRHGERLGLRRLEQKIHVVGRGQKDYRKRPDLQDRLAVMLDGLLLERPLTVRYHSPKDRKAGRDPRLLHVHPLCLVVHREALYFVVDVKGGDWDKNETRILLALDRIVEATVGDGKERFEPPKFDPEAYLASAFGIYPGEGKHRVVLDVDRDYAIFVRERHWHATQKLEDRPDGTLRLSLEVGRLKEVVDWVMSMGEEVEVVAPRELRRLVAERLRACLARYQDVDTPAT